MKKAILTFLVAGFILSSLTVSIGASEAIHATTCPVVVYMNNENHPPTKPELTGGPPNGHGKVGVKYEYSARSYDPDDGDEVYYKFDWGDGNYSGWIGPWPSGEWVNVYYIYYQSGTYEVRVKAKDTHDPPAESDWSDPLIVTMPVNQQLNCQQNSQMQGQSSHSNLKAANNPE